MAKLLGGDRVPLSGAVKTGNLNLTGDVTVRTYSGAREFLKLEVKSTARVTPKGDKTFTLKKSVLDQAVREANEVGSLGALWIHFQNNDYLKDFVVMSSDHFTELVEYAKLGVEVEERGFGENNDN